MPSEINYDCVTSTPHSTARILMLGLMAPPTDMIRCLAWDDFILA
jgi:hypothetical protein